MLNRLPPELLVIISEFLPPVDVICLFLCNRTLYGMLGGRERKALKPTPGDTWLQRIYPRFGEVWNRDREHLLLGYLMTSLATSATAALISTSGKG
jgi:hypothetical protein